MMLQVIPNEVLLLHSGKFNPAQASAQLIFKNNAVKNVEN